MQLFIPRRARWAIAYNQLFCSSKKVHLLYPMGKLAHGVTVIAEGNLFLRKMLKVADTTKQKESKR